MDHKILKKSLSKRARILKWRKVDKIVWRVFLGGSLILCVGVVGVGYKSYKDYEHISKLEVKTFDSVWARVYKSNHFVKLNASDVDVLQSMAHTPEEKDQAKLAEASYLLIKVNNNPSDIKAILSNMNSYYHIDLSKVAISSEQKTINDAYLRIIESFINDLKTQLNLMEIKDNMLVFDETNLDSHSDLKEINTTVPWRGLNDFNALIKSYKDTINRQVAENLRVKESQKVIELKKNLDSFMSSSESLSNEFTNIYISGADFKAFLKTLDSLSWKEEWFAGLVDKSGDNSVTLSEQFYIDNPNLVNYADLLKAIVIKTNVSRETSDTTSSYRSELKVSVETSADNLVDNDMVLRSSIGNALKLNASRNVEIVSYEAKIETSSSTKESSSVSSSSSSSDVKSETKTEGSSSTEASLND